jgi:Protein of unknown function (DUF1559)
MSRMGTSTETGPAGKGFKVLGTLIGAALLVALVLSIREARSEAEKSSCISNLKQIGLALHNYLAANGTFPPAYVTDNQGRPMHSWRLLLLPYFEGGLEPDVYGEYDFSEPWDGPHNRQLIEWMPDVYHCPHDKNAQAGTTSYVAIVGGKSAWLPGAGRPASDFQDGLSNTIFVAETAGLAIPWTEPHDIDFAKLDFKIGGPVHYVPSSTHRRCANVLLSDGSVRTIGEDVAPKILRAWLTIAGGEQISPP